MQETSCSPTTAMNMQPRLSFRSAMRARDTDRFPELLREEEEICPPCPPMNMHQTLTSRSEDMNMDTRFLLALRLGDPHRFRKLLRDDPTLLHGKTIKGNSILHVAASNGYNWLINEAKNLPDGLLLRQNVRGDTFLHCAARAGQLRFIDQFFGQRNEDLKRRVLCVLNERGDTALHEAARGGHVNAVRELVGAGPDMAAVVNGDGESPLYLAAVRGSVEAVRMLLGCSAVEYGGPRGQNALHAAVCRSCEIAKMLLEKNPELNQQVDASQSAPIHYATSIGDANMVRLLLKYDPFVAHIADNRGLSAIHIAASNNYANLIVVILNNCHDANELTDNKGNNFLHVATNMRAVAVVRLVLRNHQLRPCINETNHEGNTPLHLAVMNHDKEIVGLLLSYGKVDANVINCKGLTPLDVALSCDDSNFPLTMNLITSKMIYAGSKHGPNRMYRKMGHEDQPRQVEERKRQKALANNLSIMAVLIATVTFSAAFTLPGGYSGDDNKQEEGMPILAKKLAFKTFLISDTIAMIVSIYVAYLLILTSSRDQTIRSGTIIRAQNCILVALGGLVLAFSMGIYAVLESKCKWLAVLILLMASFIPYIVCAMFFSANFEFVMYEIKIRMKLLIPH